MSGKTVNSAILLLVIGNAMALISDVFIKLLEPGAPVFQFAFLRCLITLASRLQERDPAGLARRDALPEHLRLEGGVSLRH